MKRMIMAACVAALGVVNVVANTTVRFDRDDVESRRTVKAFHKIVVEGSCDVHYVQGNTISVRVVGRKNDVAKVATVADGTTLHVKRTSGKSRFFSFDKGEDVDVYVSSPDLTDIVVKGSGEFSSRTKIDSDNLSVTLLGSGDIELHDVICDKLSANLKGSGDIELKHLRCANAKYDLLGSGDIKVNQLQVRHTDMNVTGSGEIEARMNHCGTVKCTLTGSGNIELKGDVEALKKSGMGSGRVQTAGLTIRK